MNPIAECVKAYRKAAGMTQAEFAARSGLGLRFVCELEQGKPTVRMDKVNVALAMFGLEATAGVQGTPIPLPAKTKRAAKPRAKTEIRQERTTPPEVEKEPRRQSLFEFLD